MNATLFEICRIIRNRADLVDIQLLYIVISAVDEAVLADKFCTTYKSITFSDSV